MNWYLTNIEPQNLCYWKANEGSQPTWTCETVASNTVCASIVYDGVSPYTPPANMNLVSSNNVYNPGDTYNG